MVRTKQKIGYRIPGRLIAFLTAMGVAALLTYQVNLYARPAIRSAMEYQCRAIASQSAQQTILKAMKQQPELFESLYRTQCNESGRIQAIYPNISAINQMKLILCTELEELLENAKQKDHPIPLGTILGFQLLSDLPAVFRLKILQQSYVVADVSTELRTAGVNQTEFLIYVNFDILMSAMVGGYASPISIRESIPVVQMVIMGDVPGYYSAR